MNVSHRAVSALIVALFFGHGSAHAQDGPAPVGDPPTVQQVDESEMVTSLDQAARLLFRAAQSSFRAGDYETALSRFKQAYEASPRVLLLFNIATTLDRLRRDEEALVTFERFLAAAPDFANRLEVEGRIRVLRTAIEARERAAQTDRATAEQASERAQQERRAREAAETAVREEAQQSHGTAGREPRVDDTSTTVLPQRTAATDETSGGLAPAVALTFAGLAIGAGALAIWGGVSTVKLNDQYEQYVTSVGATPVDAKPLLDDASSRQLLTNLFIGGAAALGVATVVLLVLTDWSGSPDEDTAGAARYPTAPLLSFDAHGGLVGFVHHF